ATSSEDAHRTGAPMREKIKLLVPAEDSSLIFSRMGAPVRCASSELVALGPQLREHPVDAALLDGAHPAGAQPQGHPALLGLDPEALRVQVGQKAAAPFVISVGDSVTSRRLLAGDLANAGHISTLKGGPRDSRAEFYTSPAAARQDVTAARAPRRRSTARRR